MGHRIQTQNRGRGGPTYRAPSHLYRAEVHHAGRNDSLTRGKVLDIEHDPARHGPVALVSLEDGRKIYVLATEGTGVGDSIAWGRGAEIKSGKRVGVVGDLAGIEVACRFPGGRRQLSSGGSIASGGDVIGGREEDTGGRGRRCRRGRSTCGRSNQFAGTFQRPRIHGDSSAAADENSPTAEDRRTRCKTAGSAGELARTCQGAL